MTLNELIVEGLTFAMDDRDYPKPRERFWRVHEIRGWEIMIAPFDICCIPPRVSRSSFEAALSKGAIRPCSMLS